MLIWHSLVWICFLWALVIAWFLVAPISVLTPGNFITIRIQWPCCPIFKLLSALKTFVQEWDIPWSSFRKVLTSVLAKEVGLGGRRELYSGQCSIGWWEYSTPKDPIVCMDAFEILKSLLYIGINFYPISCFDQRKKLYLFIFKTDNMVV